MKCPCCQRPRPLDPVIDGIWYRPFTDIPTDIAYRCVCGSNRSIPWADATREQRQQAYLAQLSRDAASETMLAPAR